MKIKLKMVALMLAILTMSACSSNKDATKAQTPAGDAVKNGKGPGTEIESFMSRHGETIVKDFYHLSDFANLGSIQLSAMVIYRPDGSDKVKGLKFDVHEAGYATRTDAAFLDQDEMESLSQSLGYVSNVAEQWAGKTHEPYSELMYRSKSGFRIGFYQRGADAKAFCASGGVGETTAYLGISDLKRIKSSVDEAIQLLKTK